ncbi:MAG: glycogen synthase GlgA [Armatimonadota bacterium]
MSAKLKILFAAAEVVPFAKTGGLADVAGALPQVLAAMGHDVRIVLPRYKCVDRRKYGLRAVTGAFPVPLNHTGVPMIVDQSDAIPGVPTYFLRCDPLYDRFSLYGQEDDDQRFVAYARGILDMLPHLGWMPDVIHCNDWHAGLVPVYLKTLYAATPGYATIGTVLAIHNLAYQGSFSPHIMELAGLPWELFTWDKLAFYDQFNFLKAGLLYADRLCTVSPTYAKEIQTPEYGAGLDGVLRYRRKSLTGILNGIDYAIWNPEADTLIPANFSADDLSGKRVCKRELQRELHLPDTPRIPLLGVISRLSAQKGFDLLEQTLPDLLNEYEMQVVVLGTGDQYFYEMLARLADQHKGKMAIALQFDNRLAHRIYAGCDALLMPSAYEPCGLGQIISLAYGTVPVARATGGLADTVINFTCTERNRGNGFTFTHYTADALRAAMLRCLDSYTSRAHVWERVMQNSLTSRFTWEHSAKKYVALYREAVSHARAEK